MRLDLLADAMRQLRQTEGAAKVLEKELNEENVEDLLEELENLRAVMDTLSLEETVQENDLF